MPRIIETTVYELDELSEAAKEKARSWYREHGLLDEWHDFVFEDFCAGSDTFRNFPQGLDP